MTHKPRRDPHFSSIDSVSAQNHNASLTWGGAASTKLQKSLLWLAPLGSAGVNVPGYNNYCEFMQLKLSTRVRLGLIICRPLVAVTRLEFLDPVPPFGDHDEELNLYRMEL